VFPLRTIDESLARLRAAAETAGRNLVDLERDPTVQLLDAANLRGASAAQWAEARNDITQLWLWYTTLEEHLVRAGEIRRRSHRVSEADVERLATMVGTQSIELSTEMVPVEQRQLLDSSKVSHRCSPDELLQQMSELFDRARAVVSHVGETWNELVERVTMLREQAAESSALAAEIGCEQPAELTALIDRLTALAACTAEDPLSVSASALDEIDDGLRAARAELDALVDVRDQIEPRLDSCAAVVEEIRLALESAAAARRAAIAKIAGVELAAPPAADLTLPARLDRIRSMAARGDWRGVAAAIDEASSRASADLAAAKRALAEAEAPIATRNELRGLIDAYQAKAFAVGVGEDETVTRRYEEARDLLFNAPTDLVAAEQAVVRFRAAISEAAGRGGRT
jgi:hypothetical protein